MKIQKLMVITAIVCLLASVSVTAMAETLTDCGDGSINGGTFDAIVIDNTDFEKNFDCAIVGVSVGSGGVRARNVRQFILINSYIEGDVRVRRDNRNIDSAATILNNVVEGGDGISNIVTRELLEADVRRNTVKNGNIRVIDDSNQRNQYAQVLDNRIKNGNLRVNGNLTADVENNTVIDGNITCSDNEITVSRDNIAVGGRVNCSRDLLPGE